jgi:hypothetical protein
MTGNARGFIKRCHRLKSSAMTLANPVSICYKPI